MEPERRIGRTVGAVIIVQLIVGFLVNFTLEAPLFDKPGFLVNAAPHSTQIGLAVLLGLVTESLTLLIAVTMFPLVHPRGRTLALWFGALGVVLIAVAVLENAAVMSMVSVSSAWTKAAPEARPQFEAIRIVVASARNWPHFLARMLDGCTLFVFYALLYRLSLAPRALTAFGLLAAAMQVIGVSMPLFGHEVVFPLLAPLGVAQLILALWLLSRGFRRLDGQALTSPQN